MTRSRIVDALVIFLKGMAMGLADSVPGVSGGTIAVITRIYERLIHAIKSVNPKTVMIWRREGAAAFWRAIDGSFLLTLALGILSALVLMANLVLFLLTEFRVPVMAFFIGLVLSSAWFLRHEVRHWRAIGAFVCVLAGFTITGLIGFVPAMNAEYSGYYLFLCGAIAICAMILPGLSGAFILLLLGVYELLLDALRRADMGIILIFASGCVVGLLAFSHVLSWLFHRFREQTYAFLTGMLLGSVIVLWPWKDASDRHVLPATYQTMMGQDAVVLYALLAAATGAALIIGIERAVVGQPK